MKKLINFKRERDLGAIITDAFGFIRTEWKHLFTIIFKIIWPFLVISLFGLVMYFYSFRQGMQSLIDNSVKINPFDLFSGGSLLWMLLSSAGGIAIYTLLQLVTVFYVKAYINNPEEISYDGILREVKSKFWSAMGYLVLTGLISLIGLMLCFAPGIYFYTVFSLGIFILVFEDKTVGQTISHCYVLIKDKWFETFGVIIVVSILVGIIGYVFSIPQLIYYFVKIISSISKKDPTVVVSLFSDPIYLALNIISYAGRFLLSAITIVAFALMYFDLNEQKFKTGAIESIDNLGI